MLSKLIELWKYRELVRNLVARDLKVRYKNSVLGIAWSWLNPLLMMLVFTLVFDVIGFGRQDIERRIAGYTFLMNFGYPSITSSS